MQTSQTKNVQNAQKKPEPLVLSKKNLIELIESKKMKSARTYIEQLRNSNPKAEKYVREVLEEVFCQKKVKSANLYMYALVFYKNLLISGELDYYEDNQFFPHEIHDSVAKICQFSPNQANPKSKGIDYFKSCVKVEPNEKLQQDLPVIGVAVVVYAMQLLQSMAEWYKEDYFTGQDSRFLKAYKSCVKKGIIFPKKTQYVYIKEQDKTEFEQNYQSLFEENQDQTPKPQEKKQTKPKPVEKKQQPQQDDSKLLQLGALESKVLKPNPQKDQPPPNITVTKPVQTTKPKQNLNEPKNLPPQNSAVKKPAPSNIQPSSLISQVKQKKVPAQNNNKTQIKPQNVDELIKKVQLSQLSASKKTEVQQSGKTSQRPKQNLQDNSSFDFSLLNEVSKIIPIPQASSRQPLTQSNNKKQTPASKPTQQKDETITKTLTESRFVPENKDNSRQITAHLSKRPEEIKSLQKSVQKKENSRAPMNPSPKRNIKRTEQVTHKGSIEGFFPPQDSQHKYFIKQNNSNNFARTSVIEKKKHKIFERIPERGSSSAFRPGFQKVENNDTVSFNAKQFSDGLKINFLGSNVSFSPNQSTLKQYDTVKQSQIQRKRSVPKTQKKNFQQTFSQNQDLMAKFGVAQNLFNIGHNKATTSRFPMKTLSAWRCQKQIKREFSPENHLDYHSLKEILKKLKFKELVLPFVPQYFQPVTLKMFGLRKSALQLCGFSQTSQVFFNNKIIEARLMKPTKNTYILSILNVSRFSLQIGPADMKKIPHSNQIRIVSHGVSNDSKTVLHSGCYMDIHFTFHTNDLNFKFLPFNLLVDQSILPLQLPITLLDQCQLQSSIAVNTILSYTKKCVKIINSDPFRMNIREIPNFMKTKNETSQKDRRSKNRDEQDFWSFTLGMKVGDSQSTRVLSCCISSHNKSSGTWRVEIIFDSLYQETEAYAKVMVQLFTFLLSE